MAPDAGKCFGNGPLLESQLIIMGMMGYVAKLKWWPVILGNLAFLAFQAACLGKGGSGGVL